MATKLFALVVCALVGAALAQSSCSSTGTRRDCGYVGINQQECQAKGCCWNPVNPNPSNLPWCFYQNVVAPYSLSNMKTTPTGYTGTLTTTGSSTPFGAPISPLSLTVDMVTADTVRVKITDASSTRWEIPTSVLPEPQVTAPSSLNFDFSYTNNPFSFKVTRKSDSVVIFDTSVGDFMFTDQFLELNTALGSNPNIYGLGEHREPLRLYNDGHTYTMWTRDDPTPIDQNAYGSHPFYLEVRDGGASHGAFLRNSNGMDVTVSSGKLTYRVIGGILDFYIFTGPTPSKVIEQYHGVIGFPHMPPFWSLGWHQCRYGYKSVYELEAVVANYTKAGIPLDTMWSDIDHMDAYKDFTFDPTNYPVAEMKKFVSQLHSSNQQYVVIVDPGIHNQAGYAPYDQGEQANIFLKEADGTTDFVGKVWPGSTVYPDFLNPNAQQWWTNQISAFLNTVPIDGLWIDMNELSNFNSGPPSTQSKYNNPPYAINNAGGHASLDLKTTAMDCVHHGGVAEYDAHNLFGLTEAIATKTALEQYYSKRSFVLSRSTFAGSGVWTAHWSGDNFSQWASMASSIPQMLSFNMFGVPLIGSDICGFIGTTTEELCARWSALGSFYPFSRNHDDIHSPPQEPYRWASVTRVMQKTLAARYSLLPYYYTLFFNAHAQGGTVARPLFFEFPSDASTYAIDSQFMIGPALMVSPVLTQGATTTNMYFPDAQWFSLWTGDLQPQNGKQSLPTDMESIQVHLRGGNVVPMQQPTMRSADTRASNFTVRALPDTNGKGSGSLFFDDGYDIAVGEHALVLEFALDSASLTSSVQSSTYTDTIPPVDTVEFWGVNSQPSGVTVSRNGGSAAPYSSFAYNSSTKVLRVTGLNLNAKQPFNVKYTA